MITLYALSTCPWCRKTKQLMAERGVDCRIVDVDLLDGEELEKALKEIDRLVANRSFPVVRIGDQVIQGFKPDLINEALDHEGK
jgi:glutaredoxin